MQRPNGVPCWVYTSTPHVLRFLWLLLRLVWEKQAIPKAWCRTVGILIPKERESSGLNQFKTISLLNVEGKVVFSVMAQRLTSYLEKDSLMDMTVEEVGIPGFGRYIKHTGLIWNLIHAAKIENRDFTCCIFRLGSYTTQSNLESICPF